jgi:hypothetical protein
MKKIGIVLTGEAYGKGVHKQIYRNWELTKDNIKDKVINSFKKENDVKVYITTYDYDQTVLEKILNFYSPTKHLIIPYKCSHQRITYIESMKNLLDQDLDFIIATRFDLSFLQELSTLNWDYEKINFACRDVEHYWKDRLVNDCLYGIPKKYLEIFIRGIEKTHVTETPGYGGWPDMHRIFTPISEELTEVNINFLIDGHYSAAETPFYEIIRSDPDTGLPVRFIPGKNI